MKCVIKQFTDVFLYMIIFFINIKLKKYVTWFFVSFFNIDKYKTKRMCDKAVDDSLAALKLIPDRFVTSKMIKKLYTNLYADDGLLFLMKILVMSHFVVKKWVFLV